MMPRHVLTGAVLLALLLGAPSWGANSTTAIQVPDSGRFTSYGSTAGFPAAYKLMCSDIMLSVGIDNAVKVAMMDAAQATGNVAMCIYDASGTQPVLATVLNCPDWWTKCTVTGLTPFTLNAETAYRLCFAVDNASLTLTGAGTVSDTLLNIVANHYGQAANDATSAPFGCPGTTGAITKSWGEVPKAFVATSAD